MERERIRCKLKKQPIPLPEGALGAVDRDAAFSERKQGASKYEPQCEKASQDALKNAMMCDVLVGKHHEQ